MSDDNVIRLCRCVKWKANIFKIDEVLTLHSIRTGWQYDGQKFEYCPWCGAGLLFQLREPVFPEPAVAS